MFDGRDVDTSGLETRKGSKTFRWHGSYVKDLNEAVTVEVDLNVLAERYPPKIPQNFLDSRYVFLANTHPARQQQMLASLSSAKLVVADTMNLWIQTERPELLKLLKTNKWSGLCSRRCAVRSPGASGCPNPTWEVTLASLTTRAELREDHFVVNGQKVWTSGAHQADLCMCFVRTDTEAPKHRGISVVIIDMKTPGIVCRPLPELTDPEHVDFNEVFFSDVEVPVENLVGELNKGWAVSQDLCAMSAECSGS